MSDETPRFGLKTYEQGDEDWSHNDTVETLDEVAIARGPISDRPAEGAYDDELYYATDQRILWGWDESAGDWRPQGGLGSNEEPIPGGLHVERLVTDTLQIDRSLPSLDQIGEIDPSEVHDALRMTLSGTPWTDPLYRNGPAHGVTDTQYFFSGTVLAPDGRVILVPRNAEVIGLYRPVTDEYEPGPAHGYEFEDDWDGAFFGGAVAPDGRVILAPRSADQVGIFDPGSDEFTVGPSHGEENRAFAGAVPVGDGRVILAPNNSLHVGIFDPEDDSYTAGPEHGETTGPSADGAFQGAALLPDGRVVFVPLYAEHVGIFDPSDDSYVSGPTIDVHDRGSYYGGALAPDGRVVFAPRYESRVGLFDPATDTFVHGPDTGLDGNLFHGAATGTDGRIYFAPRDADHVGIFDPEDDSFTQGPAHTAGEKAFAGACATPNGKVVFGPRDAETVGVSNLFTTPVDPVNTMLHPLVQTSV